jgi:hypothetical protein
VPGQDITVTYRLVAAGAHNHSRQHIATAQRCRAAVAGGAWQHTAKDIDAFSAQHEHYRASAFGAHGLMASFQGPTPSLGGEYVASIVGMFQDCALHGAGGTTAEVLGLRV